jgi:hypothetical protein
MILLNSFKGFPKWLSLFIFKKLDFLQKSVKGEGERGKGMLFSLSPLTFSLFPPLAKNTFARGLLIVTP